MSHQSTNSQKVTTTEDRVTDFFSPQIVCCVLFTNKNKQQIAVRTEESTKYHSDCVVKPISGHKKNLSNIEDLKDPKFRRKLLEETIGLYFDPEIVKHFFNDHVRIKSFIEKSMNFSVKDDTYVKGINFIVFNLGYVPILYQNIKGNVSFASIKTLKTGEPGGEIIVHNKNVVVTESMHRISALLVV